MGTRSSHPATQPFRFAYATGPERVDYDKANACGNAVLGSGRCIGYTTRASDGEISVQFIGLSRTEADRIVRSIPL